jgi:hypothetical protein
MDFDACSAVWLIYVCNAGGMWALMEDVRDAYPARMLLWLLSNVSADEALLAVKVVVLCRLLFPCSFSLL